MSARRRSAARVYEVLPYRRTAAGREFLVHQDGGVIRGTYAGGNLAEEASWALAEASGYVSWFRRWYPYFLGIQDQSADPLLYQFAPDLTGLQQMGEVDRPAMAWVGDNAVIALGDPRNQPAGWYDPRTIALYGRVLAHLQQASEEGDGASAAPREQAFSPIPTAPPEARRTRSTQRSEERS